jgi:hypothetical protein
LQTLSNLITGHHKVAPEPETKVVPIARYGKFRRFHAVGTSL